MALAQAALAEAALRSLVVRTCTLLRFTGKVLLSQSAASAPETHTATTAARKRASMSPARALRRRGNERRADRGVCRLWECGRAGESGRRRGEKPEGGGEEGEEFLLFSLKSRMEVCVCVCVCVHACVCAWVRVCVMYVCVCGNAPTAV